MRADYYQSPATAQNPHELFQRCFGRLDVLHHLVDCDRVKAGVTKRQLQGIGDNVRDIRHSRTLPQVHPDSIVTVTAKRPRTPAFAASRVENPRSGRRIFIHECNVSRIVRQRIMGIVEFGAHRLAVPILVA